MDRKRSGPTLVEWFVIIACVEIVLGLLLPAIGDLDHRKVSRRNQCSTNLKNFALAGIQYANNREKFPGFVEDYGTWTAGAVPSDPSEPDADTRTLVSHRKVGTWAVSLLPWLDAQPTYEQWTDDRYPIVFGGSRSHPLSSGEAGDGFTFQAAPNLAIFQCPSNPLGEATHGRNSYVCNAGLYHRGPGGEDSWQVERDGELVEIDFARSMGKANGVFNNKIAAVGIDGVAVPVGPDVTLDDFKDGLGMTMLFSENLQAMPWHRAGFIDAADLVITENVSEFRYPETCRYTQGMVWHYEDDNVDGVASVRQVHRINGASPEADIYTERMNVQNASDLARPSSAHVDGVNVGMADGATRFISDAIDYRVYQALLTPRGKKSDVPMPEFKIPDDALSN